MSFECLQKLTSTRQPPFSYSVRIFDIRRYSFYEILENFNCKHKYKEDTRKKYNWLKRLR